MIKNCSLCNKEFEISTSKYNWAIKSGYKCYCGSDCQLKGRRKKVQKECFTCKKEIMVTPSVIKKSKSGKFYCSKTCGAKENNKNRERTEEYRKNVSESLQKFYNIKDEYKRECRECLICCKKFFTTPAKLREKKACRYCSKECSNIGQWGSLPYTKEEVINILNEIKEKNGNKAPSSFDVNRKLVGAVNKFFKSWNKGMKELGFIPNTEHMLRLNLTCIDGHRADSHGEKQLDDWLSNNKIEHERCKQYPNSKKNCDFYLKDFDVWIEYFGLAGNSSYDKCIEDKKKICEENGMRLIEIYPKDISKLDIFLAEFKN